MKKKLCAGLLATSMILSSSVMAFAAGGAATSSQLLSGATINVTGSSISKDQEISAKTAVDAGVINVDMPKDVTIILNPYAQSGGKQVVSTVMPFKNYGNVGVQIKLAKLEADLASQASMLLVDENIYNSAIKDVNATVAGKPQGVGPDFKDAKFGTIYLESAVLSDTWTRAGDINNKLDVATAELSGALVKAEKITSSELVCVSANKADDWGKALGIPVSATPITLSDSPVTIGGLANTATGTTIIGRDSALLSDSMAFVKFAGALNPHVLWEETDSINAKMIFRVQPAVVTTSESLFQKYK